MSKPTSHKHHGERRAWSSARISRAETFRALHRQPRADGRERQRDAEKNVRVIREPLRQRIKTNHHQRDGRQIKAKRIEKITRATNPAAERTHSKMALASEICPAGRCRLAVRGLSASNFRSTMRLNAIAQVRAQTIAARISPKHLASPASRDCRAPPRASPPAQTAARKPCARKRTNEAHF